MGQEPIPSYMDVRPGGWVWVLSLLTSYKTLNQSLTLSDSASLSLYILPSSRPFLSPVLVAPYSLAYRQPPELFLEDWVS